MTVASSSIHGAVPPKLMPSSNDVDGDNDGFNGKNSSWQETNLPILATAFSAALATGAPTYAFGLYGSTLKSTLHLTQSQLDTISAANFCAGLISWIPGMCVDSWGPKFAMVTGGFIQSIGLFAYWVAAKRFADWGTDSSIVVPVLSCLGILIFMSNSLVIGSLFKVIVVSCGSSTKGSAVGAAKGYVGLGSGAYSCLFDALRTPSTSDLDFLPMASVLALAAICAPALFLLPNKEHLGKAADVATSGHYHTIYLGLLILALLILGTSSLFLFQPLPSEEEIRVASTAESASPRLVTACVILLAWVGPIVSLFLWTPRPVSRFDMASVRPQSMDTIAQDESQLLLPMATLASETPARTPAPTVDRGDNKKNYTLVEMLGTAQAWLFLWTSTILVGSGTVMTNNMGQMVEALEFPSRAASAFLAMFSVSQAMARVGVGAISDSASSWKFLGLTQGLPRPVFLIVSSMVGAVAHAVLATATSRHEFLFGVVLSGIAFGMIWPLMVLIIGEMFGTVNHGANYMFYDGFTSAIGTLVISKYIAQTVYEEHIDPEDVKMDDITCYGPGCFKLTHVAIAVLCVTCLGTSIGVLLTTISAYRRPVEEPEKDYLYGSPYLGRP